MKMPMTDDLTHKFYEDNAEAFFKQTVHVDMSPLYGRFLQHVPAGGSILDAGCGSGRDSKAFKELGFQVTAFDAAPALVAKASALLGQDVLLRRFDELDFVESFDAIWACASLLHVAPSELTSAIERLSAGLKHGGVLYASFKNGNGQRRDHSGRHFTDMDIVGFAAYISAMPELGIIDAWDSKDQRPGRVDEVWLNLLLRKS